MERNGESSSDQSESTEPASNAAATSEPAAGAVAGSAYTEQIASLIAQAAVELPTAGGSRDALACALRMVCEGSAWSYGEAWGPSLRDSDCLEVIAEYASDDRLRDFSDAGFCLQPTTGHEPAEVCWRENRPVLVEDVAREPPERFRRRDLAQLHGLHTALAVPVVGSHGPEAVLVFFRDRARSPEPELIVAIAAIGALLGSISLWLRAASASSVNHRRQAILAEITALGVHDSDLETVLPKALHLVLGLPGLALRPMGAIFLADEDGTELRMVAQENLASGVQQSCRVVPFGRCLCGSAAETGQTIITADVDERHSIAYEGMLPHGHYCAPLRAGGLTLGVLCLYTDPGREPDPEEETVVESAARTLAGLVLRSRLVADLAISQRGFTELVSRAPMAVLVEGADKRVRFANKSCEKLFGLTPGSALGTRSDDFLEWRGDEAVLRVAGKIPALLRVSAAEIVWAGEAARLVVLVDITAQRAMQKLRSTVVGAHYPDLDSHVIRSGATRYEPEKRAVTVLFVDMKDSTSIAAKHGETHLAELLAVLYRLAIDAVDAAGGSISNFMGDAVMATFNAPLEDVEHPWHAVQAGAGFLRLLASHCRDNPEASFHVHVGIETGDALVGDVGPEARHLYTVMGECVHFASRLSKLPVQDRVVVGHRTAQALEGRVVFEPWGPVDLSGYEERQIVYLLGDEPLGHENEA